jgi:leucyl-tRNA synthetase
LLDWPESLKKLQINWIGRSEGVKIHFTERMTSKPITVFTTCAHTLFGVSYITLAPEHPLTDEIVTEEQRPYVEEYRKMIASKSDLERTDLNKDKSGVWTGAYALNPINNELVPVWISDYVLLNYGTGAVMGVPSHDERDFAFAKKFNLPVVPVIDPGVDFACDLPDGMRPEELRIEVLSGKRCWSQLEGALIASDTEGFSVSGQTISEAKQSITHFLVACGKAEVCVNYKLRDWLFSRQRYWGEPFPILHLEDGTKRVLDVAELPLCPPSMTDFKPSPDGRSPLAKVSHWVNVVDPVTGKKGMRETNTMPQWAGSCWYYLRFCDPSNDEMAWDPQIEKYWMPVDMYVGGVEHAVLHLLYARFWHKVLFDTGLVSTKEPFQTLRNQGLVIAKAYQRSGGGYVPAEEVKCDEGEYFHIGTGEKLSMQIEKMSKSKLNGVTPDEMIEEYGADALRLYEMFMGPFDKEKLWNTDAVNGCKRFLNRVFDMVYSDKVTDEETLEGLKLGYRVAHNVEKDIEAMQFNTAIAKMMEFMNAFTVLDKYPKRAVKMFIQALSSFAPHIAEEAWQHLGGVGSIVHAPYPQIDSSYLIDDTALYVVQVNGKLRGKWELPKDKSQEQIMEFIKDQPNIVKHLGTSEILKVVFVPNKLINIVVA